MTTRREAFAPLDGTEQQCALAAIAEGGFEPAEFVLEQRCSTVRQPGGAQRVYKLISVKRLAGSEGSVLKGETGAIFSV